MLAATRPRRDVRVEDWCRSGCSVDAMVERRVGDAIVRGSFWKRHQAAQVEWGYRVRGFPCVAPAD
jgi:hypothetical protein